MNISFKNIKSKYNKYKKIYSGNNVYYFNNVCIWFRFYESKRYNKAYGNYYNDAYISNNFKLLLVIV